MPELQQHNIIVVFSDIKAPEPKAELLAALVPEPRSVVRGDTFLRMASIKEQIELQISPGRIQYLDWRGDSLETGNPRLAAISDFCKAIEVQVTAYGINFIGLIRINEKGFLASINGKLIDVAMIEKAFPEVKMSTAGVSLTYSWRSHTCNLRYEQGASPQEGKLTLNLHTPTGLPEGNLLAEQVVAGHKHFQRLLTQLAGS